LATLGFLLSPLSWWNDLILNIPLAYGFASVFALISKSLFMPMLLIGYWLTNIIGILMVHKGAQKIISNTNHKPSRQDIIKDLSFSVLYSLIMIVLIKLGWLKSPAFINPR